MACTPRTLMQMHNRATAYEVAIYDRAGKMVERVAFTERRTKRGLLIWARAYRDKLAAVAGVQLDQLDVLQWTKDRLCVGNASIAYTGRTERDCAIAEARA